MTRNQEYYEQAYEFVEKNHGEANNDFQAAMNIAVQKAFVAGAEWADRTMLEKACKWWEDELTYPSMTQEEIKWYKSKVNEFRKAMKGGEE